MGEPMHQPRKIEVRAGRLPKRIKARDLKGPIVMMIDGKLPEGLDEALLAEAGATILCIHKGDVAPTLARASHKATLLRYGVTEEWLAQEHYIFVEDACLDAGRQLVRAARNRKPSQPDSTTAELGVSASPAR